MYSKTLVSFISQDLSRLVSSTEYVISAPQLIVHNFLNNRFFMLLSVLKSFIIFYILSDEDSRIN